VTYRLPSGHIVRTSDQGGGWTEFETRNADNHVISTVYLAGAKRAATISDLEANAQ
jgi:hypothetical protein